MDAVFASSLFLLFNLNFDHSIPYSLPPVRNVFFFLRLCRMKNVQSEGSSRVLKLDFATSRLGS